MALTNWARNLTYGAARVLTPDSVEQVADILGILETPGSARALGSRHSFNSIADTDGVLVSTASLPQTIEIDAERRVVRASAGLTYAQLGSELERSGWALPNLASLPHISVGGAIATGTHGSGDRNRSLAAAVAAVEIVTPGEGLVRLARGDAEFDGAVVALGALGVTTTVELDIVPSFRIAQVLYEGLALDAVLADLEAVTGLGYSVSLFTTWRDADVVDQLWVKQSEGQPLLDEVLGRPQAAGKRHPLPGVSPEACTEQGGVPGPWFDRLPHFKAEFTPSAGDELQSEYLVPRSHAVEAIQALRGLASRIAALLQVAEIRTIAADELWLSPFEGTDAVGLHFTWVPDQPSVEAFLPAIEDALAPFGARPHWGKLFTVRPEVGALYPRWSDFRALRERFDPRGILRNPFLERLGL